MDRNGGLDEDVAAKRDRQSYERRQLTATAREVKRRDDETRIKRIEERAAHGGDTASSYSSSRRVVVQRQGSDFSVDSSTGSGGGQQQQHPGDSLEAIAELRQQLSVMEEQCERALCDNAELNNERQVLEYEVAILNDKLEDSNEANRELNRAFADKRRENAYLHNQVKELLHQCDYVRRELTKRDQLIAQSGCVLLSNEASDPSAAAAATEDDDVANSNADLSLLLPRQLAERVASLEGSSLQQKLQLALDSLSLANQQRDQLQRDLQQLQEEVDSGRRGGGAGKSDAEQLERLRENARQLTDYKYKLATANQEITALQADVIRLEGQVKRLTKKAEECEEECQLAKAEARNQKRGARELSSELEDARSQINSLRRNLDRLKSGGRAAAAAAATSGNADA